MNRKFQFTISVLTCTILILWECKKEEDDPFFDIFPKTYVYASVDEESPKRIFTDGKEIFNEQIINKFGDTIRFFKDSFIENSFERDTFTFIDNTLIKYNGCFSLAFDTLYYQKRGDKLYIESELNYSAYPGITNMFYNKEYFLWKLDSIDYYFDMQNYQDVYIYKNRFECYISEQELSIPVLVSVYVNGHSGSSSLFINKFDENFIPKLTTDTLAIQEFRIRLVRKMK